MGGYAKRIIRLDFPGLTDDDENDPVWVAIRNPRLVPNDELVPDQVTAIVDGQAVDVNAANSSMHEIVAKLVVGWRVYDPTQPVQLDAAGNDVTPQVLLPCQPGDFTAENCAKLPMVITNRIGKEMAEAANPPAPQDHLTSKTSTP
jgi:hypothetical protein